MPVAKTKKPQSPHTCKGSWIWMVIYFVIILAIILGGLKIIMMQWNYDKSISSETYQAVFLTNGQVYFGQLDNLGMGMMELKDVYYLQVSEDLQAQEEGKEAQQSFTLVKLGDELHKPTSEMAVSKRQILFWENLQSDSPVLQTILTGGTE